MKTYKVNYINWKGKAQVAYLIADNREQAEAAARVLQGLEEIEGIKEVTHGKT